MSNKLKVTSANAQELIKDIRLLAMCGKSTFMEYLFEPLREAGWQNIQSNQSSQKEKERIRQDSLNPAYIHTIAPRCKKLISISMNEGPGYLGDASIFFLDRMQIHTTVSSSPEAISFTDIIEPSLDRFRKNNNERSERLFTEAMTDADIEELTAAFDPVQLDNNSEKIRLDSEIRRLYENIRIASQYHNIPKCRKLLSSYIIQYSDNDDYAAVDVDKLVTAMDSREPGFKNELRDNIAIDLYYKIKQGVLNSDIHATISAIRKYSYIFEGDETARYFYDIDRLERILYRMISDKGLWDKLKKR